MALVLVPVPLGGVRRLRAVLESLARSRGAGGLPAAPGSLAVLILAAEPEALSVAEQLAPDYPFPLHVEDGLGDAVLAVRQAAAWAATLGVPGVPILLTTTGEPVPPRWAYSLLAALRDGADLVTRRAGFLERLLAGVRLPVALSLRAQTAMERWSSGRGRLGAGAAWTERDSPWRRPDAAGLRTVPA
ncbi:hypothetical protein [Roseomonas indoligenes]|uniref:Uncharacterized protein n=1 Tax=Roseomonas indoligenes TaxID=2820811 RepID=A0A940MXJ0_9PROT|nr:hypothetical protein [Pararoseomonas indoligenes]MBP0491570.1 hypothetical protein [Pararoseomonas indoligenes]